MRTATSENARNLSRRTSSTTTKTKVTAFPPISSSDFSEADENPGDWPPIYMAGAKHSTKPRQQDRKSSFESFQSNSTTRTITLVDHIRSAGAKEDQDHNDAVPTGLLSAQIQEHKARQASQQLLKPSRQALQPHLQVQAEEDGERARKSTVTHQIDEDGQDCKLENSKTARTSGDLLQGRRERSATAIRMVSAA